MANNNISVNVTHNISGGGSSGGTTAAEGINKDFQIHLQDVSRGLSDLNHNLKSMLSGSSGGAKFTNPFTGEGREESNKHKEYKDAFASPIEDFNNAVTDFNNSQKDHADRMQNILKVAGAIPFASAAKQYVNAYSTGEYLAARNDKSDPAGYGISQARVDYEKKGAVYKFGAALAGAGAGALAGAPFVGVGAIPGAAVGAYLGYQGGDSLNNYMNQGKLGQTELEFQQSQTEAQLTRANPTGAVLANLYKKGLGSTGSEGLLSNQLPYMGGSNAYRGNMSENDLTGMAQFSKRYGLEGQSAGQASTLLAQIAGYMGDMNSTLHQIDAYQSQYGGDTLQQLATMNSFLQSGSSANEALNATYKSGYSGQAFQNAQGAYLTSDFSTRLRQEAFGQLQGFSVSKVMHGTESEEGMRRLHNSQSAYALGRGASGIEGMSKFAESNLILEGAGLNFMMGRGQTPTGKAAGSYDLFGLSKGESTFGGFTSKHAESTTSASPDGAIHIDNTGSYMSRDEFSHMSASQRSRTIGAMEAAEHSTSGKEQASIQALINELKKLNSNLQKVNR